jgi:hypothetical protein
MFPSRTPSPSDEDVKRFVRGFAFAGDALTKT